MEEVAAEDNGIWFVFRYKRFQGLIKDCSLMQISGDENSVKHGV